jgi:uncharacterized protein
MPAFDITPRPVAGRQQIEAYGDGGFRIGGSRFQGSVIVLPERTLPWPISSHEQIDERALEPLFATGAAVEVLLVGCGRTFVPPPASLAASLKARGMALEWMDSGAACRTFNVLLGEERQVAAALLAIQ